MFLVGVGVVIFLIGAVVGSVVRVKSFLVASLLVASLWAILGIFSGHGFYSILMAILMAIILVILMLAGAAIGRTLKQAFLDDELKDREGKAPA